MMLFCKCCLLSWRRHFISLSWQSCQSRGSWCVLSFYLHKYHIVNDPAIVLGETLPGISKGIYICNNFKKISFRFLLQTFTRGTLW